MDNLMYEEAGDLIDVGEDRPGFTIDDDEKAEWALQKIQEAECERSRLTMLVEAQQRRLNEQKAKIAQDYETATSYLKYKLEQYMQTVPVKSTKTRSTYQLLSGKLIRKKPALAYSVNNEALLGWLKENGKTDLVKVTEAPRWGDLKKMLVGDPETGVAMIAETGEVVDGITAAEDAGEFSIQFN